MYYSLLFKALQSCIIRMFLISQFMWIWRYLVEILRFKYSATLLDLS